MKTTAQYLSIKKISLRNILTLKVKSTVQRYKTFNFWLKQGLKRFSEWNLKKTQVSGRTRINDIFRELDENRNLFVNRLNADQELYPKCDTSIWLRNCTLEIPSPIQGIIVGKYEIEPR